MQNGMEKNNISFQVLNELPNKVTLQEITVLYTSIFKNADITFFKNRLEENLNALLVLAYHNEKLIGFKIGYPYNKDTFYSWIGGVLSEYRKTRIGTNLLITLEKEVKTLGYKKLRTKSMNAYKPMLILNLKNNFDIVNFYTNSKGQTKIVFEKKL